MRPRVLLTTEGTYPFVVGGVSTWCDQVLRGLSDVDWDVLPIAAGGARLHACFKIPPNVRLLPALELWSEDKPGRRHPRAAAASSAELPAALARGLLSWWSDLDALIATLVQCRENPGAITPAFHSAPGWYGFVATLRAVEHERYAGQGPQPRLDLQTAAELYQTTYWIARTAAAPTPAVDLVHVTAAGWAAIPAAVDKSMRATPVLLTEHGVYVREAYLAAVRADPAPAARFASTRLARGLTRVAYHVADIVAPVTTINGEWERSLGVAPLRVRPVPNGVTVPDGTPPLPRTGIVVSVGRLDPLKDVKTMLRVAAEVIRRVPGSNFRHFGPVPEGQEPYAAACRSLHTELGLGDRFQFMGPTTDPYGAVRDADVVLLTSISEGFPMAVLEAMSQARPIVATSVGGVPEAIRGCGFCSPPGDVRQLAAGVVTLLEDAELASKLGHRGQERVRRQYPLEGCLATYRELVDELVLGPDASPRMLAAVLGAASA